MFLKISRLGLVCMSWSVCLSLEHFYFMHGGKIITHPFPLSNTFIHLVILFFMLYVLYSYILLLQVCAFVKLLLNYIQLIYSWVCAQFMCLHASSLLHGECHGKVIVQNYSAICYWVCVQYMCEDVLTCLVIATLRVQWPRYCSKLFGYFEIR